VDPIRQAFDRVAARYAADFFDELDRKPYDRDLLRRLAGLERPPGPVIEVGCGPGHVGRFLAGAGMPVIGLDVSVESLVTARRLNPGVSFVGADMRALPLRDASCTGVVAFYSLIYWDDKGTASILREMRRVLRPRGLLALAVHGGAGSERFTDFKGTPVDVTLHYHQPERLAALASGAGFAVERADARPPYPEEHPTTRVYLVARATDL
jgi:ubiquinone/menaquinone biosynthesis C-methylase UbiE